MPENNTPVKRYVINLSGAPYASSQTMQLLEVSGQVQEYLTSLMNTKDGIKSKDRTSEQKLVAREFTRLMKSIVPKDARRGAVAVLLPSGKEYGKYSTAISEELQKNGFVPMMLTNVRNQKMNRPFSIVPMVISDETRNEVKQKAARIVVADKRRDAENKYWATLNLTGRDVTNRDQMGGVLTSNSELSSKLFTLSDLEKSGVGREEMIKNAMEIAEGASKNGFVRVLLSAMPAVTMPYMEMAFHAYGIEVQHPIWKYDVEAGKETNEIGRVMRSPLTEDEKVEFNIRTEKPTQRDYDYAVRKCDERMASAILYIGRRNGIQIEPNEGFRQTYNGKGDER